MNDREIILSIRDMQGSDGKEGHWYILGEPQRAALTRLLDATDPAKAEGHAKVLLDDIDDEGRCVTCVQDAKYKAAHIAGAHALTENATLKKRVAELEAALQGMITSYEYEASAENPALLEARRALQGDGHE